MTHERLRELLRDRVADETMPDHSARAWQRARVVRRRYRLGAVAGVVAATAAISGGIAAVESTPPRRQAPDAQPATGGSSPSNTVPSQEAPDATYEGVPVWWSPDQLEERELEPIESQFPAEIRFGDSEPLVPGDLEYAIAAFARGREVVLLGPEGDLRTVDVSRLDEVTKPNGYSYFPTSHWMLPPEGDRLVFRQPGHDAVFSIRTGVWSTAPRGTALAVQDPPEPGFDASAAQQYGAAHLGAASWGMGVNLPIRDEGSGIFLSGPEFLVAETVATPHVLAFMDRSTSGQDTRFKNCCPVAGWLADGWVVYESRQVQPLLVAWRVGTQEFRLVSRIDGPYDVAAFA